MATTDIESLSIELYLLFMYQITTQQWFNIVTKLLGIRSCSYEEIKNNDYIAASYSLNPDTSVITDFAVISNDFIVKLINTINLIISFNDSHERYLAIVSIMDVCQSVVINLHVVGDILLSQKKTLMN